jgi:hypothetical protein
MATMGAAPTLHEAAVPTEAAAEDEDRCEAGGHSEAAEAARGEARGPSELVPQITHLNSLI